jgi:hypothetical protein
VALVVVAVAVLDLFVVVVGVVVDGCVETIV